LKLKTLYGFREVGGKFVDIGSGSGKAVFAAALLHKFDDCVGIEILEGLHNLAEEVCMCLCVSE
jgi:tRNA G46 methylase TrmB